MRMLNETRTVPVSYTGGRRIEAIVRVSGVDARAGGRGFTYQRHEPQAIILRGEDDIARITIPGRAMNIAGAAAPIAIYLLARALVKRRRMP